ncbi:iron-containing alcohol dehydrogenase [Clostridium sp. Marseille-P3244]|uniref:iron-containing alcohol dehydrogenase n=1 Tax=Clostridium sp. Marseille-P3244 TaxID=1871020 RepID=UPI0009307FEA|nr:iron-containing alcohol dehydrogenase [Clostridium sp. Marseille-P3244]
MRNFTFLSPTKIIFGRGAEEQVGNIIKEYGSSVLIVHYGDEFIRSTGLIERVRGYLEDAGIRCMELDGIKPNPTIDKVYEGIELCRENKIETVLAVGGGSVIDSAKGIAVGAACGEDILPFYLQEKVPEKTLPMGSIVTIAASGSESSNCTCLYRDGEKIEFLEDIVRPKFAILDPELTVTLPHYQTFCGIIDIFSHVLERYCTTVKDMDFVDHLCEGAMRSIIRNAGILARDPANYAARAEIMLTADIVHNDLLHMGGQPDVGGHWLAQAVSELYDLTHGATIAMVMPAWLRAIYKMDLERFAQYAVRVWGVEYDPSDLEGTALQGIQRTEDFIRNTGIPVKFSELGIEPDIDALTEHAAKRGSVGLCFTLYKADIRRIFQMIQ